MLVAKAILSFLFSPGGKVLLGILAFVGWTYYQRMDATSDCQEAQLQAELVEANRKLVVAERISQQATERAKNTAEALLQVEREKDELVTDLQTAGTSCALPADVRERLRAIR